MLTQIESQNGNGVVFQPVKREPEFVSPKTLSELWDIEVTTIWKWARKTLASPGPDSFPCNRIPGTRGIRIPLKQARAWLSRGQAI